MITPPASRYYLGRYVKVLDSVAVDRSLASSIAESVVLLVLGDASAESTSALLSKLIAMQPMAIVAFGIESRVCFDLTLAELSDGSPRKQIMARQSNAKDVDEAVGELFHAVWPSEDRFDDWQGYIIVNVGGDLAEITQAVARQSD